MIIQVRPDYRVTILLIAACAVFGIIIAAEWAAHQRSISELNDRLSRIGNDAGLLPEHFPDPDATTKPLEAYTEMVERPLFLAGRRPLEEQPEGGGTGEEQPTFTGTLNIKLMGVIAVPEGMTVLFVDSGGKYSRAEQDDTIEGWRVKEVHVDRVVLEQGEFVQELPLRKPKPKEQARSRTPPKGAAAEKGEQDAASRQRRQRTRVDRDE